MKKVFGILFLFLLIGLPGFAANYRIEVLQVGRVPFFDLALNALKAEMAKGGLVEGQNVTFNRTIIDADAEAGTWEKVKLLLKIKSASAKIAAAKPDLAITIGTAATKYGKDKIIAAGVPVVFTYVAMPMLVGCKSNTQSGPGFTGSTLYIDPKDVLQITKLAFPNLKTMGMIHSDDDAAMAYAKDAKAKAAQMGITIITKQVNMSSKLTPAGEELISKGIEAFYTPIDVYFGLRNNEPAREEWALQMKHKIPGISALLGDSKTGAGSVLYIAADFRVVGGLAGKQVVKILKEGAKPETLPVLRQENLVIHIDLNALKMLGIQLPNQILQIAKPLE